MGRKDPREVDGVVKYHPQLVTQGQSVDLDKLAYTMKEKSSLSLGDIQSVLTNLVEAMRAAGEYGDTTCGKYWEKKRKKYMPPFMERQMTHNCVSLPRTCTAG